MRTTALRPALVVLTLVVAVAALSAQERPAPVAPPTPAQAPPPSDQAQPVFRGGINVVRVDAIVTDNKGKPVTDLTKDDFEVFEEGDRQTVDTFRLVNISQMAPGYATRTIRTRNDEETAAQDENSRIFVIFLDDYHVRLENSIGVRKPILEFLSTQLSPNDLVSVMYPLTPLDAVTLTRNHQGVMNTVEKFTGRKFNYDPVNDLERDYVYRYPTETVERIRRQVSLSALRGLSYKLGALREGRKSIILVSEGYVALLPPQKRDAIAGMPGSGNNPQRYDPLAGERNPLEERVQFSAETDLLQELQDVFDAANRSNTSIYAVDPRGLSTGEFDIADNISFQTSQAALNSTMNTLRTLAENTDGRAIVNRNDLARGMQQIVRDSSAYYLLGYNSTRAPQDGKFHEIRVRVKRPGLQVRARRGYWALTEAEVARATAPVRTGPPPAVTKALSAIAPMTNRRFIRTWIGTGRGATGQPRVTFLWERLPPTAGVHRDEARRVSLLATTAAGDIVYRGRLPIEAPTVSFDAQPGTIDLRLTIEGDGGTIDTEDRQVAVPDLTAPEVRLSTPRVWIARNAREYQAIAADAAALPTATREFRRTDRLLVRFEAFTPAAAPATVTVRLLNQQGAKMTDITVAPPAGDGQPYQVDLPLANLAAGQYLLEVSAGSEGHQPVSELVAFRLSS